MNTIFTTRKPRRFQHIPLKDPRKEALEARIRKIQREMGKLPDEEFNPEDSIRGRFFNATTHLRRRREEDGDDSNAKSRRMVKLGVWLIVLTVLLIWIIKSL
jgi:hypothetical protein